MEIDFQHFQNLHMKVQDLGFLDAWDVLAAESSYIPDHKMAESLFLAQIRKYKPMELDIALYENAVKSMQRARDFTIFTNWPPDTRQTWSWRWPRRRSLSLWLI